MYFHLTTQHKEGTMKIVAAIILAVVLAAGISVGSYALASNGTATKPPPDPYKNCPS